MIKKIKQAEEKERSTERQIQKSLYQTALYIPITHITFQSTLLQVIPIIDFPVESQQVYQTLLQPPQVA
ncbi:hypothetical protein HH214_19270 [Mucilaginibacter robiniae]|uniref:Uncharacterized protein n=1 Tax=Mucilaginibacter robiniae TaxID=2728022 RepID=A0A7L5E7P9_9SPHI|nr:hypothetical protein [Mucilaginibacter robiniae]QJD97864.1 hypothetical protein HH214_19270 [Mucilaginibacter robiniae]